MWLVLSLIGILVPPTLHSKLTGELIDRIEKASPDEMVECIVIMKQTYPYEEMESYPIKERIKTYQTIAEKSQQPLIDWLSGRSDAKVHQQFWVLNGFHLVAKPEVILTIANRDDVAWISFNYEVRLIEPVKTDDIPSGRPIEWNILRVMADSCWRQGFTGEGIIIGETDTGVDYNHPALAGKWAGYFHVAAGLPPSTTPYDDHGHGTHCMGTILGGDGFGPFTEDIGVAPGAKFVASKVLNSGGSGSFTQCIEGLQWHANLKSTVDIKAVSNSWGGGNATDTAMFPVCRTLLSVGILPIFANGNSGPDPGTVRVPGSYSNVIGVGATTNAGDSVASFSSRGPSPNQVPYNDPNTWLRSDWNFIKPNISAPGAGVRSCVPNGGYQTWNGTSMATPHVAGAVAIICQKNPRLSPRTIYSILVDNVDRHTNVTYPNNNYGWGRLNVWKALRGTPVLNQPWLTQTSHTLDNINPGGTGYLRVTIQNVGGDTARNTTGILRSFDNYVTIINNTHNFGTILPNGSANNNANPYSYRAHSLTPPGHIASIGLILHADGKHDTLDFNDTIFYSLRIGTPPPPYTIYEDDFEYGSNIDSFLHYWDRTGNWNRATNQSYSPPYSAYSGTVNNNIMTLTLKNSINLTQFTSPELKFWHKYRFEQGIFLDSAVVHISTNGGTSWIRLWRYDWMTGDTIPWQEQTFSLSSYISNNVKIRFAVDAYTFFNDYADWWIDNFRITVPTDNAPPYFTNTTVWRDTVFTGPFPVRSTITDASGVDSVYLYYRINNGPWQRLTMTHQGSNIYQATIPAQSLNTTVHYYLWARDRWINPNSGCDPVGAPTDGYYAFRIGPVGISEQNVSKQFKFEVYPNPFRNHLQIRCQIPDARYQIDNAGQGFSLAIYDVTGRVVKSFNLVSGIGEQASSIVWFGDDDAGRKLPAGVYFVKLETEGYKKIEKAVLLK